MHTRGDGFDRICRVSVHSEGAVRAHVVASPRACRSGALSCQERRARHVVRRGRDRNDAIRDALRHTAGPARTSVARRYAGNLLARLRLRREQP
jgi:hypothetical protein